MNMFLVVCITWKWNFICEKEKEYVPQRHCLCLMEKAFKLDFIIQIWIVSGNAYI